MSRGGCPRCGKTIPLGKSMLRRGRAFACRDCGSAIVVPKTATSLAILGFILLSFLSDRVPFALIVVLIIIGVLIEWLLVRVEIDGKPASTG